VDFSAAGTDHRRRVAEAARQRLAVLDQAAHYTSTTYAAEPRVVDRGHGGDFGYGAGSRQMDVVDRPLGSRVPSHRAVRDSPLRAPQGTTGARVRAAAGAGSYASMYDERLAADAMAHPGVSWDRPETETRRWAGEVETRLDEVSAFLKRAALDDAAVVGWEDARGPAISSSRDTKTEPLEEMWSPRVPQTYARAENVRDVDDGHGGAWRRTEAFAQDADDFSQNASLDVDDELSAFNDDDTGDYDPRVKRVVAAAPAKMAIVGEFNDDDDDDDFREDKKPDATGVTVAENDFEDEFVFLEDGDGEEETGWEEDDENRDFEDDDGLFLTDADDSLTRKTAAQAKGASVKSCRYLQSCVRVKDCPPPKYPEIAVIGRSNVGKSSLINMLTGRTKKEVAKTSKNPGKTQTINHFEMVTGDGTWYLTDLPGYGFANAPEKQRRQWALFTREYLLERENLIAVMLLIDSTVKPQRLDLECLEFLGENDVPVTVVFTKVDKKRKVKSGVRARPEENVEMFCREVSEYWEEMPPMIFTSSKTGDGKQSVLNHVATLRQFFKEGQNGAR